MKTINNFYFVEVYFFDKNGIEITSICIKTKIPPFDFNNECRTRLKDFLTKDLETFTADDIGDIRYISEYEAYDTYDCSNIDNWPVFE